MHAPYSPWAIAPVVLLLNLPFGYWRALCRKFSFSWFVSIHAPIILGIALRLLLGIPFRLATFPFYVLAFLIGQSLGGRIHRLTRSQS